MRRSFQNVTLVLIITGVFLSSSLALSKDSPNCPSMKDLKKAVTDTLKCDDTASSRSGFGALFGSSIDTPVVQGEGQCSFNSMDYDRLRRKSCGDIKGVQAGQAKALVVLKEAKSFNEEKAKQCEKVCSTVAKQLRSDGEQLDETERRLKDNKDKEGETPDIAENDTDTGNPSDPGPSQETGPQDQASGGGLDIGQLLPLAMMALAANQDEPEQKAQEDPMKKFCEENPGSQVCGAPLDCNNPDVAALNQQQCLCANPATARVTPICNQKPGGGVGGNFANLDANAAGRGTGLLGTSALSDLLGDQSFNGAPVQGQEPGVDANQKGGGGGGPNAGGGGGGASSDGGGGGHGKGPYDTDILKGVAKGGGGAGAGGGGHRYGGGGSGAADDESLDLTRFLPGDKPSRGIAGMAIKKTDGLTGPFGPSIWEKISRRYRKMRPFLKQ